jgi:hypothetical protein
MRSRVASYGCCPRCHLLQAIEPDWLREAYRNPINLSDTGILVRNLDFRDLTAISLTLIFGKELAKTGSFLDYGGGYGIFVRLMRDLGFDFYWNDPHTENILASGFDGTLENYTAIVAFEIFEHVLHPLEVFEEILSLSGTIIFSTELYGEVPPPPAEWPYYGFSHGQHITFFNLDCLKFLANQLALNFVSDGKSFHIMSREKISPSTISRARLMRRLKLGRFFLRGFKSKTLEDWDAMRARE